MPKSAQNIDEFGLGEHDEMFPQSWWHQSLLPFRWQSMLKLGNSEKE